MDPLADLLGESAGIVSVREQVRRLLLHEAPARRQPPVLIRGETGTGKGLLARSIHNASRRGRGPFVAVNCAAIPEPLLEAELFGVESGAFTDARQRRSGLFQSAHRGTLFLDEVAALPPHLQAKILTAIEDREVRRLGSARSEAVDVWVLSATGVGLEGAIAAGDFRADLYHRLSIISLCLPPLRERGQDTLQLAGEFLARACADYGRPPKILSPDARAALLEYRWPGNVRELANVMERVTLMTDASVVTPADLALPSSSESPAEDDRLRPASGFKESLDRFERTQLIAALEVSDWNVVQAAQQLGIARTTLRHRMTRHRLARRGGTVASAAGDPESLAGHASAPRSPGVTRREERTVTLLRATSGTLDRMTSPAMDILIEKVELFGGEVVEVDPSGLLAAFGVKPVEDAPSRAAQAALSAQNALARGARDSAPWPAATTPSGVAIALHAGPISIESAEDASTRLPVTLPPEDPCRSVLEALLTMAEPDSILVSPTTVPFLERRFTLASLERADGREGRVLVGLEPTGLGLAGRPLGRLVGRQQELGTLHGLLGRAGGGQGQVVGLIGEPGVGKSRLVYEFRESLAMRSVKYFEGHCRSSGTTTPYGPVLELARQALEIGELDSSTTIEEKVQQRLQSLGMDPETSAPYLLDLLAVKTGAGLLKELGPAAVKLRTFETLREIFLRLSREIPVILVVEDLHWIDPTSREYLASLVGPIARARILLLTTCRPACEIPWLAHSNVSQVAVSLLSPAESLAIVRGIASEQRVSEILAEAIVQKAGGNPFFLEEMTWNAATEGETSTSVSVPGTIGEVLRARIDRLPPEDRGLLQTAAVMGRDVLFGLLLEVAGEKEYEQREEELRRGLGRLQAAEFLYETASAPDLEYTFRHALTQEVAYASLPPEDRRRVHARVVRAIEHRAAGRLEEQVERLAYHAFRGEIWDEAVRYLRQAGNKALTRSAHREAAMSFEQAIQAVERLPGSIERDCLAIDLRLAVSYPLYPLLDRTPVIARLREAQVIAERIGDQHRLGLALAQVASELFMRREYAASAQAGSRALVLGESIGDLAIQCMARYRIGQDWREMGRYQDAAAVQQQNLSALEGELRYESFGLPVSQYARSGVWLCLTLSQLGEFSEGIRVGEEVIDLLESINSPYGLTHALWAMGEVWLQKGDLDRARNVLERGLAEAWPHDFTVPRAANRAVLGFTMASLGQFAEGEALLEEAIRDIAQVPFVDTDWRARLAEVRLWRGALREAGELARQTLEAAVSRGERGNEAWILRLLGEIATRTSPLDIESAEINYRRALTLATELGMRPLISHCHLGLGTLYRRTGEQSKAREHFTIAATMFGEMDMQFWLEKVNAAMGA